MPAIDLIQDSHKAESQTVSSDDLREVHRTRPQSARNKIVVLILVRPEVRHPLRLHLREHRRDGVYKGRQTQSRGLEAKALNLGTFDPTVYAHIRAEQECRGEYMAVSEIETVSVIRVGCPRPRHIGTVVLRHIDFAFEFLRPATEEA